MPTVMKAGTGEPRSAIRAILLTGAEGIGTNRAADDDGQVEQSGHRAEHAARDQPRVTHPSSAEMLGEEFLGTAVGQTERPPRLLRFPISAAKPWSSPDIVERHARVIVELPMHRLLDFGDTKPSAPAIWRRSGRLIAFFS
jgi:hypothetical protein